MNKYRKEYCEENGRVKINPENTKLYDYIKHLENKLEQAEQLTLTDVVKQSELLCECGGNERIALDCTMKPCKHPKYYNK